MKVRGYKVIKIYVEDGKLLYDVAVFGENSLIIENIQTCERIFEKVTSEEKNKIAKEYENELLHNFINDTLVIF